MTTRNCGDLPAADLNDFFDNMISRLRSFPRRTADAAGTPAAVAIAVTPDETGNPSILLTIRTASLRAHSSQYALPGGRVDAGESAVDAAMRELEEELSVDRDCWEDAAELDDFVTRSGYVITPVVMWSRVHVGPLAPNPAEVAEAFVIPVRCIGFELEPTYFPDSEEPVLGLPLGGHVVFPPTGAIIRQFRDMAVHGTVTRVDQMLQPGFAHT